MAHRVLLVVSVLATMRTANTINLCKNSEAALAAPLPVSKLGRAPLPPAMETVTPSHGNADRLALPPHGEPVDATMTKAAVATPRTMVLAVVQRPGATVAAMIAREAATENVAETATMAVVDKVTAMATTAVATVAAMVSAVPLRGLKLQHNLPTRVILATATMAVTVLLEWVLLLVFPVRLALERHLVFLVPWLE